MARHKIYVVEVQFDNGWHYSLDAVNPWSTKSMAQEEAERLQNRPENEQELKYRVATYVREKK